MKNKVLAVILGILMFVPTVVAIINFVLLQGGQADSHNTVEVRLTDSRGHVFVFTRENGKDEMLDYFIDTINGAKEIESIPISIQNGDYFIVDVFTVASKLDNKPLTYKFYYTESAADCYFAGDPDDKGIFKSFRINEKDADEFIKGAYSAALYENGNMPVLELSGKTAAPDSASWSFKNAYGEYVEYDCSAVVDNDVEKISLEGGLAMNFSLEPDTLDIKITDKKTGEVYDDISKLPVTKDMDVEVEAVAKWHEDTERTYFGEQTFKFSATFGAPAHFYAGVTNIQVGEFICVTGVNVNNPEKITFTSEPDINYSPVFFTEGEYVHALVPFNWSLKEGDYVLTFSYGGSTQQININVGKRGNAFLEKTITMPDSTIENFGTNEKRSVAESELRPIAKQAGTTRYWENGETLYYDDTDLAFAQGYGHTYSVSGTDISFRNTGVDFRVESGTDIKANLKGEIVYAGILDYSGFTVVIDHGYGLKSWYAHLGSTSVKVGDIVEKGDTIGEAGESGFTSVEGVHIGMTIYDVPVCTYAIWKNSDRPAGEKGIVMYEAE